MHLIENFNEEESSFKSLREKHEYIQNQSKVILDPNHVNSHLNIHHINFDYKQYAANLKITKKIAKQEYMRTTLLPELKLREKDMNDVMNLSYTAKIELLQVHLIKEEYLSYIYTTLDKSRTTREAALVLIEQCIPCSLHLDLRITEKTFKVLLQEGLNKCENNNDYIKKIEDFINNVVFGRSERRTGHWKFPLAIGSNDTVADLSIGGQYTYKYYDNYIGLIDACIENEVRRSQWKSIIQKYIEFTKIINQKTNFTDNDIDKFDDLVDDWFQEIVDNFGINMITNYIHMLGSGHVSYYMKKYRNLYRYNQQGWEGLNSKITDYFFRHSGKGGGKGNKLYIDAVGRMLLRDLMWRSGLAEKFFNNQDDD